MIIYVGNCEWRLIKSRPTDVANGLPGLVETWFGRADHLEQWKAQFPLYTAYRGGYITKRDINDDQGPFATGDLIITLPPDFGRYLMRPSWSIKTATKSANVTGPNLIPPALIPPGVSQPNPLPCTRTVSFYSPECRYQYFADGKPDGARFGSAATGRNPIIIRSTITCQLSSGQLTFNGNAPAAIVSALAMQTIDRVTSVDADPIAGTSWYECTDTVGRELQGDS